MRVVGSRVQSVAEKREEQALLRRVLKGEQRAWVSFCQRYEHLILGCVLRVLRRYHVAFSSADLADLVAEVWVALLRDDRRKLRLYDHRRGYRLASWVGLIATNCTIDQLRQRSAETSYLEDLSCSDQLLAETECPDSGVERQETVERAHEALSQLSPEEREFIRCCYHDERTPADLARELGIAVNTVYSRKFKIREKLVRIVADLDQPQPASAFAA